MLITAIENFVLLSSLLAIACFAIAWAATLLVARGSWTPQPQTLTRLYSGIIVMPPIVAAWIVTAAFLPEWWLGEAAFNSAHPGPAHDLHLIGQLTANLEPALAYLTASFVVSAVTFAALSSWRGYVRVGQVIGRLDMNAEPPSTEQLALVQKYASRYSLNVGLVMSSYPLSFVWGFRHSKLILSTGLLGALTGSELQGVLEHEVAHHQRRDNLMKLALSFCGYTSLAFPLSRLLLKWLTVEVEKICDEVAVSRTRAPLEIASALVKVRRHTSGPVVPLQSATSGLLTVDTAAFEQRVRRLMGFLDTPPMNSEARSLATVRIAEILTIPAAFSSSVTALIIFSPLAVHRGVESLIHIIK